MVAVSLVLAIAVLISVIIIESWCHSVIKKKINFRSPVLFLFAHADDDAMFFTPTIEHVKRSGQDFGMFLFSSSAFNW